MRPQATRVGRTLRVKLVVYMQTAGAVEGGRLGMKRQGEAVEGGPLALPLHAQVNAEFVRPQMLRMCKQGAGSRKKPRQVEILCAENGAGGSVLRREQGAHRAIGATRRPLRPLLRSRLLCSNKSSNSSKTRLFPLANARS
jgi:hypothetical protein